MKENECATCATGSASAVLRELFDSQWPWTPISYSDQCTGKAGVTLAMSIEAFLYNYRGGEPVGFTFDTVRRILSTDNVEWLGEYGCLCVRFRNPSDSVNFYFGKDAKMTNHTDGITISRPIMHPDFLQRVFRVMKLGDVMLFYSDQTTPVFIRGADAGQYPIELLQELGEPRYVDSPSELPHKTQPGG